MKRKKPLIAISIIGAIIVITTCALISVTLRSPHERMIGLLKDLDKRNHSITNTFNPEVKLAYCDSMIAAQGGQPDYSLLAVRAPLELKTGDEEKSVNDYRDLMGHLDYLGFERVMPDWAIAYMRLGERTNCMMNHTASSCIFPIEGTGVHRVKTGSQMAINIYESILRSNRGDLESKWLLNIAFMTLGRYPKDVPSEFLIPNLDADTGLKVKPFNDVAAGLGLDVFGRAGGVIVDDFNNDGYLDIITSGWDLGDPMHYFQNNQDGTFTDMTEKSGLKGINGGLNIQQVDYNNDGNMDIFVLRGAWNPSPFGDQPVSLLRNNGDGTFTDVTMPAGLLCFQPTQAATWADFNNDGWPDVFIGAETSPVLAKAELHPCALYINNHDGTFTNVAAQAHCDKVGFIKGVTSADYNNDGWQDIFISTLNGQKYLLKNTGKKGRIPDFEDVTEQSGLNYNKEGTFTTWFFDYNNDGWPDIMVADYRFERPLSYYAAAEAVGKPVPNAGNIFLFRNNRDGTFTDVTKETRLDKVVFSMGANFGDIDNDGYPDMYFGTGNPDFKSLIPNKLFKNVGGKRFADVTISSRTGNLQKGHGVAFADLRNTGIQDIFIEMGGAFKGDSYNSSLYMNPGQNNNNWISLKLEGVKANRCAIGTRIKLSFTDNGLKRSVYKDVNSGGSFGSSPLQQEIGIGQAKIIDDIQIRWAGSGTVQHFTNVRPCQFLRIKEGKNKPAIIPLKKLSYKLKSDVPMNMRMDMTSMNK